MSSKQYIFAPKQRRTLYLVAGLLWLVGTAIFYWFDGLSVLSLVVLSLVLIGCSSYAFEIKWWVNIGIIAVGVFWIGMSYLEHIDPGGATDVKEWWILGITAIFAGIYWLIQRAIASFIA